MNKAYTEIIHGVEDMDGTCAYIIGSDKPLPQSMIKELNRDYISINRLELFSKIYEFSYEAIEYDD